MTMQTALNLNSDFFDYKEAVDAATTLAELDAVMVSYKNPDRHVFSRADHESLVWRMNFKRDTLRIEQSTAWLRNL